MTAIMKVTVEEALTLADEFYIPTTSFYYNGTRFEQLTEKACGSNDKITLSLKNGKRRRLVTGRIITLRYESNGHEHPGFDVLKFVPNNRIRFIMFTVSRKSGDTS